MKYALLIYTDPSSVDGMNDDERRALTAEYLKVRETPGVYGGDALQPIETATTVRVSDGATLTTDGPFADTKEILGGYFLLEADNIDEAIATASRVPATWMGGAVEVRPIVEQYD
jgi:hypothetical protein